MKRNTWDELEAWGESELIERVVQLEGLLETVVKLITVIE